MESTTVSDIDIPEYMAFNVAYGQMSVAMLTAAGIAGQVVQIRPMIELCRPLMVEEGTYQELMEKNGFFTELVRLQQL